jgi:L,D-transpeptidase catalytic domain
VTLFGTRQSMTARCGSASRAVGVLILALLAFAPPAAAIADNAPGAKGGVRLSNEWTFTRWAHPVRRAPIRWLPTPHARLIVRTHYLTEDGFPEVYPLLRSWRDSMWHTWLKVRIPMRPNGRTGWVRRSALGPPYRVRTLLVVDRRRLRATLYKRGRRIWRAPVGVGKSSTPTPAGRFWVREKFRTPGPSGLYGPVAFGSSDYSVLSDWPGGGVVGIHGTSEPFLIPGRPSHGCIRVQNKAVRRLWHLMPVGTPLRIR